MRWTCCARAVILLFIVAFARPSWSQGFTATVLSTEIAQPWGVAVADFDGDGDLDVAVSSSYGQAIWIETRGTSWVSHPIFYSANGLRGIAAGDFNGDGRPDIVVAAYGDDRFVFLENTGRDSARFEEHTLLDSCNGAFSVRAGDVNGDGLLDLVTLEHLGNRVRVFEQHNGQLVQTMARTTPSFPLDATFADLDGDGDMDIVATSNEHTMFWVEHGATDTSWTVHDLGFGNDCTGLAVADLDSSGTMDIVASPFEDTHFAWWQSSGSSFVNHALQGIVSFPRAVQVADFDMDGRPDIVGSTQSGTMQWWHNAGGGNFTLRTMPAGASLYGVAVSDFDQDGDPDVIVADYSAGQVKFYRNTMGIPAVVSGTVRWVRGGTPVAGATVRLAEVGTTATTDNNGVFRLASVPGTYTLRAQAVCWNDTLLGNVQIAQAETTQVALFMTRPVLEVGVSSLNVLAHNRLVTEVALPMDNSGDGLLTVLATAHGLDSHDDWLSVTPSSAQVAPGEHFSFTVNIHPDTSNAGSWDYLGRIELRDSLCPSADAMIAVMAHVLDVPGQTRALPLRTALHAAYPNPFNSTTTLTFDVAAPGDVSLALYDITGRAVRTLSSGPLAAGQYRIPLSGEDLSSGVYLLALHAGGERFSQKLLLIK